MPNLSYYPGCSLHGTAQEYDRSLRRVAGRLGVELTEIAGWTCCGATAAHSTDELLAIALPARNLALAAASDSARPVLAPCAMCFNRLRVAQQALCDEETRQEVGRMLDEPLREHLEAVGRLEVPSVLEVFAEPEMAERIEAAVVRPLRGLRLVCYYGCLLVRPREIVRPDSVENPQRMDELVRRLGAEAIDWPFKGECCGGSLALARSDIVVGLVRRLLQVAKASGADAVVTACPMCHSNLDTRQGQVRAAFGEALNMPILYITELMGLAFGLSPEELGLDRHLTRATDVLAGLPAVAGEANSIV